MRRPLLLTAAVASVILLAGCASSSGGGASPSATPSATADAPTGELTIYAAASLSKAFDAISAEFETEHPGVDILPIVYDGSSTLATQLLEGAAADVFASADEKNMTKITDADLTEGEPELFATNTLVIVVPAGNPGGVESLADLADPALTVVLCAAEVPCGAASQTLLTNEGVAVTPASLEQNVTAVLTKVAADEADAGLVYATDVIGRDDVEFIVPDGAADVVNSYPIAALAGSENPDVAAAFVAFVTGRPGQTVLSDLGFGAP